MMKVKRGGSMHFRLAESLKILGFTGGKQN